MKSKMSNRHQLTTVMALLLLVASVLACNLGDESDKANKLVDEGNAAVQDAKKYYGEAEEKNEKMINAVESIKNDADLAAARALAKDAIAAYDKTKAKCEDVAKKYEEASKLKVKDKFKEYLAIKVSEFKKRAEIIEAAKGTPQALIDSENKASFNTAVKANTQKVDKLTKEADDLATQADKIQKENKDIFKQ